LFEVKKPANNSVGSQVEAVLPSAIFYKTGLFQMNARAVICWLEGEV